MVAKARAALLALVSSLGLIAGSALTIVAAAAVFVPFATIDIWVSAVFFDSTTGFIGRAWPVEAVRAVFIGIFFAGVAAALAGLWFAVRGQGTWLGISALKWTFLALALSLGPGLVANSLLKNEMGRARPRQIEVFGGTKAFTPALVKAQECNRNCSFVSGEASSMFALLFALAFMFPAHMRRLIFVGVIAGSAAGLIRIAQGGHFLSDVVFAGAFMGLTVGLLHSLMFELPALTSARAATLTRRGRA